MSAIERNFVHIALNCTQIIIIFKILRSMWAQLSAINMNICCKNIALNCAQSAIERNLNSNECKLQMTANGCNLSANNANIALKLRSVALTLKLYSWAQLSAIECSWAQFEHNLSRMSKISLALNLHFSQLCFTILQSNILIIYKLWRWSQQGCNCF